jgi:hypothetical protein
VILPIHIPNLTLADERHGATIAKGASFIADEACERVSILPLWSHGMLLLKVFDDIGYRGETVYST